MRVLKLNNAGTRCAIREAGLAAQTLIGRGAFTAVYASDNPDAVWKLSACATSLEWLRFYGDGPHVPKLLKDHGYAGVQCDAKREVDLVLFQTERLVPLSKVKGGAAKKLASRVLHDVRASWFTNQQRYHKLPSKERMSNATADVFEELSENDNYPESLREAFTDLHRMSLDYGPACVLDFAPANLMVRESDGELVLNDVFFDYGLI